MNIETNGTEGLFPSCNLSSVPVYLYIYLFNSNMVRGRENSTMLTCFPLFREPNKYRPDYLLFVCLFFNWPQPFFITVL